MTGPEESSASRIVSGMRTASVSSVYPLPSVRSAQRAVQPPSADALASPHRGVSDDTLERPGRISHPVAGATRAPTRGDASVLRAPSRGGERTAATARAGARLAAGGDTWRAPAVAYNAVERRIGRDATALRAVSARLDAAATAIDAVEVGVRSASDSLDSLLHLLESRPVTAAISASSLGGVAERTSPSSMPGDARATAVAAGVDGVATQARWVGWTTGARPTEAMSTGSSSSVSRSAAYVARGATMVAGGLSGGGVARASPPPSSGEGVVQGSARYGVLPDANTEPAPAPCRRGSDAVAEARASLRAVQRERQVSTPPRDRLDGDEDAKNCAGYAVIVSAQRGASARAGLTARPAMVSKVEEEPKPERDGGERFASPSSSPEPSVALQGNRETAGRRVAEQGQRGCNSLDVAARASSPWRAGPAHAEAVSCVDDAVVEAATSGAVPFLSRGDGTPTEEDRSRSSGGETGSVRGVPGGSGTSNAVVQADLPVAGTALNATREDHHRPTRSDASLPVMELEAAMDGIDAERGRLILEIARLRGQQNESLIHLQRLQHEQVVVRQRQVSTLSDIVNSFGRTVEAAGALPHGEDSSLGRISGDVVSTLRRMLRLLSATVPVATEAASRTTSAPGPAMNTLSVLARRPSEPATRAASRTSATSSPGTYAVGGRVALRPAGDLTQEVIDAALQALPRLAAAATAISGARRIQGFLAGEGGGENGDNGAEVRDTGRRCSVETIAALPDVPPGWGGCSDGGDGDGGRGGGGGVRGCVICLSEDSTPGQPLCHLPCDHVFHRDCVGKWLRVQDSCPTCRRQVPDVKGEVACEAPAPEVA